MIHTNIEELIGNTPLLKICQKSHNLKNIDVYVKLEYLNPFGSVKDRTALGLTEAVSFESLNSHDGRLIESSSGNTAKALQLIASRNGSGLVSVTNRVKVPEIDQLLRYIGVDIVPLPGRSECPDPNDDDNAITQIERMQRERPEAYYHTEQYSNHANTAIHARTTAQEIFDDLGTVDYVITGVGTGGSSGGMIEYIRDHGLLTQSIGVVSHAADFLPGIRTESELYETALFKKEWFEALVEVSSTDALAALDDLVRNDGVLAGPTTGANFSALRDYLQSHDTLRDDGTRRSVVFLACDRLESYMSYITKRMPERFGKKAKIDMFSTRVSSTEKQTFERTADEQTLQWIYTTNATVIDMRGVKPYSAFHIEGALSYPETLLQEVTELGTPFDSTKPVLFVCPRGDRSMFFAHALRKRDIKAYSLAGGLQAWRSAKLPFIRGEIHG